MTEKQESDIQLREALPVDLELLTFWDSQPHVVASDPNDDWHWGEELSRKPPWREMLIAELDGKPIGFVQIIDPATEESRYWDDVEPNLRAIDIWIGDVAYLGKGYGTRIMIQVIARCFDDPAVTAILVDPLASNVRAHRFYERLGFRFTEARTFGADRCHVYRLDRGRKESPHL